MRAISGASKAINGLTAITGRAVSWLSLLLVLVVIAVVLSRYLLGIGSIALQESVTYIHAAIFMLGLAFTLQRGGHVRVDIFYRNYSQRRKALVDLVGGIVLLLPLCVLIFISSWDYVAASWTILEASSENDGIAAIYLLKTLMVIMPVTLGLQGIAEILSSILILSGDSQQQATDAKQIV
jgi:TRAP-type mannitol/chloroaromatic compound transport system permease small subunit